MKNPKFSHKTPHLKGKQHQLDPNLDLKHLVHHSTVQYVDRDADGDVDIYDNPKKGIPDENVASAQDAQKMSKRLLAKQKGELKHTKPGVAFEDLRNWFDKDHPEGNWKRYNTKGEAIGPCAREEGEAKPKCLSNEKAAKMSKDEIASAVKRKRREDPVADRKGKGGKPIMSSNKIEEGIIDRLRGRGKVIGRTASGGKIYQAKPKPSKVTYGGKTQDEIIAQNKQNKVDKERKKNVEKGSYDDPWLRSSPAAERRLHYQQLRGESKEETRYCMKCKKMETRDECSYGPEMWDKMTIKNFSESKKSQPDHEHSMARSELATIEKAVKRLKTKMKGEGNIEAWVQSKITKAADYIDSAADYLDSGEHNVQGSMDEQNKKCSEGKYYCNRENKCKPIPKGYHLMPNGMIMKDDDHEIEEAKNPCWKGYKQEGMKKKGNRMVPNCVPVSEASFEITHTSSDVKKAKRAKKIDALAQRGTGGEQQTAARMAGVSLPPVRKEEVSLVEKILLEMEAEVLIEKNKPTNPKLWAKWKAKAKAKFDVYPSAYANGWAAKGYKSEGGGWKSVSEDVTIEDANGNTFAEIVDIVKVNEEGYEKCEKCGKIPCECKVKKYYGGSPAKPGPDKNYVKPMGEEIEEAVRIPSKTGNLLFINLTWRGKYYGVKVFFPYTKIPSKKEVQDEIQKIYPGGRVYSFQISDYKPGEVFIQTEDWQSANRKDKTDGMGKDAVKKYRQKYPNSKLQTAVTEKNPTGKDADRQNAYCRRSKGQKDMHNIDCSKTPDKPICKARRRWNCKGDS